MKHRVLTCTLRLFTTILLAGALALSALSFASLPAFAAACNPATALDASSTPASCDMTITAQVNPGVLTLNNDAAAVVPGTPFTLTGSALPGTFNFTSVVKDHRGSTSGWRLEAASAGLINGTTTLPLSLTSRDAASTCTNGTCPTPTFTSIVLTTTATRFLSAGNGTTVVDGDYTNKTNGSFSIPAGSPSGTYNGVITITLVNAF